MTEVNIFPYKLSLSLNISDFIYVKIATPLKKITPLFPSKLPLKVEVLSSPPPRPPAPPLLLKTWLEVQPPSQQKWGGCTL